MAKITLDGVTYVRAIKTLLAEMGWAPVDGQEDKMWQNGIVTGR